MISKCIRQFFFIVTSLLLTILSLNAYGQSTKRKAVNNIQLSYTPQYYFNNSYIENDDIAPDPLRTENTIGYNTALMYQHITRYGLIVEYGFFFGKQVHKLALSYDLRNWDPSAVNAFKDAFDYSEYTYTPSYIGHRLMIGYIRNLSFAGLPKWSGETKIGMAIKAFDRKMEPVTLSQSLLYQLDDDPTHGRYNQLYILESRMGNKELRWKRNLMTRTFEAYLGLRKELNQKILKNFNCGLEYTRRISDDANEVWVTSYDYQRNKSVDYYYNKQISIGLHLGVGVWFK